MSLSKDLGDYKELKSKMLEEGVIIDTFLSLEDVQDQNDPQFVCDLIKLFISDAESILLEINKAVRDLRQINLFLADACVLKLNGSTTSLGVTRIQSLTATFRTYYLQGSVDGCLRIVNDINQEFVFCKNRLMSLKNSGSELLAELSLEAEPLFGSWWN